MENFFQDVRYGLRMLRKSPGFTFVAVVTLALGIGANTAIFSVINAALFHSLPYREPERLVHLWETRPHSEFAKMEASRPNFLDWQASNHGFTGIAGYSPVNLSMRHDAAAERIAAMRVTSNFFDVLGVQPTLGRTFREGEDRPGGERVALLSYAFWQREFGTNLEVLGQTINLSDESYTVIGVLPASFQFAKRGEAQLWVPLHPGGEFAAQFPGEINRRTFHWINMIARLRAGVSLAAAQTEMTNLAQRLAAEYPDSNTGGDVRVIPLQEEIIGSVQPVLTALLAAVAVVLLIACVNVTNLLLARAKVRQKEIAVRAALGATSGRLLRQMLVESSILALLGGGLGLLWARWAVALIIARIPGQLLMQMPYLRGLSLNLDVLGFALAVSIVTGIAFGILPGLQLSHSNLRESLAEGVRSGGGVLHHRLRSVLVVSEIALSLVLLTSAALLMKSLTRLLKIDPGFQTDNLLTLEISAPSTRYSDLKRNEALTRQLLDRAQILPGVRGAALVDTTPLKGGGTLRFTVEGRPAPAPGQEPEANTRDVSPNYFHVMGIPLLRGRFFADQDKPDSPPVLIVNKTLADRFFAGEDPVGKRVMFHFGTPQAQQIVGVVGDEKLGALDQQTTPVVYSSAFQSNDTELTLLVRSAADPTNLTSALRAAVTDFDSGIVLNSAVTVTQIIADSPPVFVRRFPALLIGIFAALAVLLSAIGVYGVLSFLVTQRTREIGVRMALGAQPSDIMRLLLGEGLSLAAFGIGIGLLVALAASRVLMGLLFAVPPTDPAVLLAAAGVIAAVTVAACSVPARRATKVDPVVALRYE